VVYLYAITEPRPELPAEPGFEGAPLRTIEGERVTAVVSDLGERVEPSESTLWEHESVVEALMGGGALLPMRFGSALADDEAVRRMLRERESQLASGLERVRGAVELGVRALWEAGDEADEDPGLEAEAASEPGAGGAGTAYLMRRLDRSRSSEALAEQIHAPLERLARASAQRLVTVPRAVFTGAYLVEEARVEDFRAAAEDLDERIDAAAILCTGPWPPYSFAPAEAGR
jgi:hypothetical protein